MNINKKKSSFFLWWNVMNEFKSQLMHKILNKTKQNTMFVNKYNLLS